MPDSLRIRDVLVLDPAKPAVPERKDIVIVGGRIAADAGDHPMRVIDGRDRLLIPGLVNAHTHSPLNPLKGTGDVLSHPAFMWLNQADTAARTPDEVRLSALIGCIEHLLAGTTAVIDHFPEQNFSERDVDAVVDAYRIAGLRALIALRIFDQDYGDIIPPEGLPPGLAECQSARPDAARRKPGGGRGRDRAA